MKLIRVGVIGTELMGGRHCRVYSSLRSALGVVVLRRQTSQRG